MRTIAGTEKEESNTWSHYCTFLNNSGALYGRGYGEPLQDFNVSSLRVEPTLAQTGQFVTTLLKGSSLALSHVITEMTLETFLYLMLNISVKQGERYLKTAPIRVVRTENLYWSYFDFLFSARLMKERHLCDLNKPP